MSQQPLYRPDIRHTRIYAIPGYTPYVDFDTFLAERGDINVNGAPVTDIPTTGTDALGGFFERSTLWTGPGGNVLLVARADDPTHPFGLGAPYFAAGYVNAGLPTPLPTFTGPNLVGQPPAPKPPVKTDEQKATWRRQAAILQSEAAAITTLAGKVCPELPDGLGIACSVGLTVYAGQLNTLAGQLLAKAADPVDLDYTEIATPASPPTLPAPDFLGPDASPLWSDFVQTLAGASVLLDADDTSVNRAEGAFDSGAPQFWVDLQMEAFDGYDQLANADFARLETDGDALGLNTAPASAPEPGTLALLGSALSLLLVIRPLHLVLLRRPPGRVRSLIMRFMEPYPPVGGSGSCP